MTKRAQATANPMTEVFSGQSVKSSTGTASFQSSGVTSDRLPRITNEVFFASLEKGGNYRSAWMQAGRIRKDWFVRLQSRERQFHGLVAFACLLQHQLCLRVTRPHAVFFYGPTTRKYLGHKCKKPKPQSISKMQMTRGRKPTYRLTRP